MPARKKRKESPCFAVEDEKPELEGSKKHKLEPQKDKEAGGVDNAGGKEEAEGKGGRAGTGKEEEGGGGGGAVGGADGGGGVLCRGI